MLSIPIVLYEIIMIHPKYSTAVWFFNNINAFLSLFPRINSVSLWLYIASCLISLFCHTLISSSHHRQKSCSSVPNERCISLRYIVYTIFLFGIHYSFGDGLPMQQRLFPVAILRPSGLVIQGFTATRQPFPTEEITPLWGRKRSPTIVISTTKASRFQFSHFLIAFCVW